jgi:hypothetical protein
MKKIIVIGIIILFLCMVVQPSIALCRDPTIISITISPEKPVPLSTITFTLEIEGENISEVYMRLKEANDYFCYTPRNVSMDRINEEIYECNVTLEWVDATYISYQPLVYCNGIWYEFEFHNQILYPVLSISVPVEGHFHLVGIKLFKTYSGNTVLLGRTKVKVDVGFFDPGIEKVEFYLNNQLMKIDNENPYDWRWGTFSLGKYLIEIKAYVNEIDYSYEEIQLIAFIL